MSPLTPKTPRRHQGPGIVSLADLGRHWKVAPATAKAICLFRGVCDTGLRDRPTYRWQDIWRIEGIVKADPAQWDVYRETLLKPADLAEMFPDLASRTIRRDLAAGRWPVIDLSDRVRRARLSDVAEELEIRAGKRPVRRSRTTDPKTAASPWSCGQVRKTPRVFPGEGDRRDPEDPQRPQPNRADRLRPWAAGQQHRKCCQEHRQAGDSVEPDVLISTEN